MIDVKEAVQIAFEKLHQFYGENTLDVLLEEVDFDEQSNEWLITIGFSVRTVQQNLQSVLGGGLDTGTRKYKVFTIDADTGEMRSMKIRTLENA